MKNMFMKVITCESSSFGTVKEWNKAMCMMHILRVFSSHNFGIKV